MHIQNDALRRVALAAFAVGVLAACDNNESGMVTPPRAVTSEATLALEYSSLRAQSGEQVSIALVNTSGAPVGSIQGYLRFDASKLAYRGQLRDAGSAEIMLVNDQQAEMGELRLAALNTRNINETASLVFDVLDAGYAAGTSFDIEEVALNGSPIRRAAATMALQPREQTALPVSTSATRWTAQDWIDALDPEVAAFGPGFVQNGLRFGDTNFSNTITTADGVYLINVSIGLGEAIIGTDGSGPSGIRDVVVAGNVFPANGTGLGEPGDPVPPGLEANGTRLITAADGLAVVNEATGNNQPVVGEVIPGRPVTPVSNRVLVNSNITTNTTWTADNIYELQGGITVTNGATLTIEPGVQIEAQRGTGPGTGGAAFFVARDGRIEANGTALQPIVMTCTQNAGETPRFKGCWGGLSILGNAIINEGANTSPAITDRSAGGCAEKAAEGNAGNYGGCNDDDDSGSLRYVRVEYAGFRFTPENELNGIALWAVGRNTEVENVQVHAGLDDGLEFFGGTVNVKRIYLTANSDDSFDATEGWSGKAQFVIVQHDSLDSDKGFEIDNQNTNNDALPRTSFVLYNATLVGKADPAGTGGVTGNNSVGGIHTRVGARPRYFNMIVQNFPFALDLDNTSTCVDAGTATGLALENSTFFGNTRLDNSDGSDPAGCGSEDVFITSQPGNVVATSALLLSPFSTTVPDFRPSFGSAGSAATPPTDGFFEAVTYRGAVPPANISKNNIPWYAGWTRPWQSPTAP